MPPIPESYFRHIDMANQSSDSTESPVNIDNHSEFPSLSGAPQPQYQNPGQAVWANANQRAVQRTPVQRPQQQQQASSQPLAQQQAPTQQPPDHSQQPSEEWFTTASQFTAGLDDYRHGGQGGVGQLSGSTQPQPGNIEEFPPLSRNGNGENGHDRRGSLMQNAAFGGYPSESVFAPQPNPVQNRHSLSNTTISQLDNVRSTNLIDRIVSPTTLGSGGMWMLSKAMC